MRAFEATDEGTELMFSRDVIRKKVVRLATSIIDDQLVEESLSAEHLAGTLFGSYSTEELGVCEGCIRELASTVDASV